MARTRKRPSISSMVTRNGSLPSLGAPNQSMSMTATAGPLNRTASEGSLSRPPLGQRIDSTWAIGGRRARMLEKRPCTHRLSQFFHAPFDISYELIAKQRNLRLLESLFYEADEDGSGTMDLDEFTKSLNNEKIKAAFSRLGIQPHQSELVFKTLDVHKRGELSIGEFMDGLHDINGDVDFSLQASELDVEMLRPGNRKRRADAKAQEDMKMKMTGSKSQTMGQSSNALALPPVDGGASSGGAAPKGQITQLHRAFVHSALAQALHPATASKR